MILQKKFKAGNFLLTIGLILIFISCKQVNLFEKNTVIPDYQWQNEFIVKGNFNITDTLSLYNIFLVIRHTDAYKYNNIWLNIGFQAPVDSMHYQKINIQLATDISGWEGSGMNDIWELRKSLNDKPRPFKMAGAYHFSINQIMRDNPLSNIMSVGLRVEKQ